ncbi:MAG: tRNA (guanosine(37)-N1)-methyltransferase TrmD [Spirochaetales bacterium]|nr:tRNA (guanosine(37)-N1)-methyltransferase TrmD [Spirochaetales bacterium]
MIFHILTLFPEIFDGYRGSSILARALERSQVKLDLINIRDFARDRHKNCDDATYGGGPGMVLKPEPLAAALESVPGVKRKRTRVVYLTPSGRLWSQKAAEEFAGQKRLALICGRYEGIDQRIIDLFVTDEISVGNYILSGGEVAAMVLIDTVVRLIDGVIAADSLADESFSAGLLEYPQYTRPAEFRGHRVPEVLLSGNHADIERWRREKSLEKTRRFRPELARDEALEMDRDNKGKRRPG